MKVSILLASLCLLLTLSEAKYFLKREVQDEMPSEVQADNSTTSDAAAAEVNSDDNKMTTEIPQAAPASVTGEMPSSEANSGQTGAENPKTAEQASSDQAASSGSSSSEDSKPATQISVETSSVVVIETKPVETATMKDAETTTKEAETTMKEAETTAKEAETPVKEAETPAKEAETPAKEAETPAKKEETPVKEAETPAKKVDQQPTNTNNTDTASAISEPVAAGSTKKNGNNSGVGFVASMALVALCLCLTANQ